MCVILIFLIKPRRSVRCIKDTVHAEIDRQVQEIQAKRKKLNESTSQQEKVQKLFNIARTETNQ